MKVNVIGALFFCFLNVRAMETAVSAQGAVDVDSLESIEFIESPRNDTVRSLLFIPIREMPEPTVVPRVVSPITVAPVEPIGTVFGNGQIQYDIANPSDWSTAMVPVASVPTADQAAYYRTFQIVYKRSRCAACRSWSTRAATHFPFGCFLCFCCCMDKEGRPILVKKCLGDCAPGEYQVCAYLTCGGTVLITLGILASAGVLG